MAITQALNLDALRLALTENPYPVLAQLRETEPVRLVQHFGMPMWLVTRYDDVRSAFGNPLLGSHVSNANERTLVLPLIASGWQGDLTHHMLMSDPPDHGRLRRAVSREFTPRRIEALRPRIEEVTDRLLTGLAPRGEAELIEDFAAPLPITIIMELLGVPEADQANFRYWADAVTGVREGDMAKVPQIYTEASEYLHDLIEQKSSASGEIAGTDLLGALTRTEGAERLSDTELVSLAFLLLVAGYTTTIDLIGNGMLALLRNPDQLALLRAQPDLLGGAIEEFLRFDGPTSHATLRFAKKGLVIGGVQIPAGDLVVLSLAAADRDPARFDDADRLDITRADRGHLAFGHGIHYCLGAPLARLEGEIALRALLDRCQDLALSDTTALTWRISLNIRGLRSLPVIFRPIT